MNKLNAKNIPNCSAYEYLKKSNEHYMNNVAISYEGREKIIYEEFHTRVEEFAKALYKKGIRRGDKVGVLFENTPESLYLFYALKAIGAVHVGYSIFNNKYKMNRDFQLANVKWIISIDSLYGKIKKSCESINVVPILYSSDNYEDAKISKENDLRRIVEEGKKLIYEKNNYNPYQTTDILFTGGSSGIHKGVELNENGLNVVAQSFKEITSLEPGMVMLGNIPFGHMVFGRAVMHYALCSNLELALTRKSLPDAFLEEIYRVHANAAMGGPVHWNTLPNHPLLRKGSLNEFYLAGSAGETFKFEDAQRDNDALFFAGSSAEIMNILGMTEMNAFTHAYIPGKNTKNTIGCPISCVKDIVVDEDNEVLKATTPDNRIKLKEAKIGTNGILLTRGPSMMLRYHCNEDETNRAFVYSDDGEVWFNTGDVVKNTGCIENEKKFVGRKGRNFVCGYENIYPEDLEALLLTLPEIKEAIVNEVPDKTYQFLPSYHLYVPNENCDLEKLKNKIDLLMEETIGVFALPGYIEISHIPLPRNIDNGKLDISFIRQQDQKLFQNGDLKLVRKYM